MGPLNCVVHNVIIRVSRCEEVEEDDDANSAVAVGVLPLRPATFGVVVSKLFGLVVGGQDCLPTAEFLELRGRRCQGPRYSRGAHAAMVQAGQWCREGDYVLWPYVCTRKPYDAAVAAEARARAEAEEAAALASEAQSRAAL